MWWGYRAAEGVLGVGMLFKFYCTGEISVNSELIVHLIVQYSASLSFKRQNF